MSKPQAYQPNHLPRYVSSKAVCEELGISRSTLSRMVRADKFPPPEEISPGRVGWRIEELNAHLDARRKSLASRSVTNPEDLPPDELIARGLSAVVQGMRQQRGGEEPDPEEIIIRLHPEPQEAIPVVTLEQLAVAEGQQLAMLEQTFADYSEARALFMAAYLHPPLRPALKKIAADAVAAAIDDPGLLYFFALCAMNEVRWQEEGLPKLVELTSRTVAS